MKCKVFTPPHPKSKCDSHRHRDGRGHHDDPCKRRTKKDCNKNNRRNHPGCR